MNLEKFYQKFGGVTESYHFYDNTVELRFDTKDHQYLFVEPDGSLTPVEGVTSVCHIIDKSEVLIPWACKMMAQKLLDDAPKCILPTGDVVVPQQTYADFEKFILGAKGASREKLEEAGKIGHTAHNWIEQYIKAVLADNEARKLELLAKLPTDERAQSCCIAALDWMKNHNVRWISTERKIYSRRHQYAGTLDGLALVSSCDDPNCRGCRGKAPWKDRLTVIDWKTSNYLYMEYLMQTAAYQQAYQEETGQQIEDRWVIRLGKDDAEFDPWHVESQHYVDDWHGFSTALMLGRAVAAIKDRLDAATKAIREAEKAEKKAAKEAEELAEKERKAKLKAEAKAARVEALKQKCGNADKYRGVRYPKCNGGDPCQTCLAKYQERHPNEQHHEQLHPAVVESGERPGTGQEATQG